MAQPSGAVGQAARLKVVPRESSLPFGAFEVDKEGIQIAHKMVMFQWQGGKKVILVFITVAAWFVSGSVAEAQKPIRIGASASRTGAYAALGENQLRGYQLCVKHTNEKGGVKFIFMMASPVDVGFEGAIDLAARNRLKTMVVSHHPDVRLAAGTVDLAKKKGLQMLFVEEYPAGTTDFTPLLTRVRAANPDLLGAGTFFEDSVAVARQMKALNVNPRMFAATVGVDLPRSYEALGRDAEFVYGVSRWVPELVTLRAGGLIPIARQYPGAREFVDSYRKEFPGADLSYHSASGYGACQILVEAVKRAGFLDGAKVREAILKIDLDTVYGGFKVDKDGFQISHKMVTFQWQDGKKVIVWPEELAPGKPRFPTPPWSRRQ